MLARSALAASADGLLEGMSVDLDAAPDRHVVDRHAGVLAKQVVGFFRDTDVLAHGGKHAARRGGGFVFLQAFDAMLYIGRKNLQCPDIQFLGGFFHGGEINVHTIPWGLRPSRSHRRA
jgi:hypothetical protein